MKNAISLILILISVQFFSQEFNVKFNVEKTATSYLIFADNNEYSPMSAQFQFTLDNMKSSIKNEENIVIPSNTKKNLVATITAVNPKKSFAFKYTVSYNFGDVTQENYDTDFVYNLPFKKGKSYRVDQGYGGAFSHQNQFALDFNLKEGDEIFAAREGTVTEIVENFNQHCSSAECAKMNNKIIIMHSDGTFAEYAHLQQYGVEVNLGDQIKKGQFIGYSGNTGFSKGPHLHFSVFLNRMDGNRKYIPTKFKTQNSLAEQLEEKKTYTRIE